MYTARAERENKGWWGFDLHSETSRTGTFKKVGVVLLILREKSTVRVEGPLQWVVRARLLQSGVGGGGCKVTRGTIVVREGERYNIRATRVLGDDTFG